MHDRKFSCIALARGVRGIEAMSDKRDDRVSEWAEMGQRGARLVTSFRNRYMSIKPASVFMDVHGSCVLVTLRRAVSPAAPHDAGDRRSREILERLYAEAYDGVGMKLESATAEIAGRRVRQSRITVDPVEGDAFLLFTMEGTITPDKPNRGKGSRFKNVWEGEPA